MIWPRRRSALQIARMSRLSRNFASSAREETVNSLFMLRVKSNAGIVPRPHRFDSFKCALNCVLGKNSRRCYRQFAAGGLKRTTNLGVERQGP